MPAELPETILQFGTGRFLRAFADAFIQYGNDRGQNVGRVVVVQSTAGDRAGLLADRHAYHILVRGLENGQVVDRVERVECIRRALPAATRWDEVLAAAASPAIRTLISNTTEAGYATDPSDRLDDWPAKSFPARLTQLLWHRCQKGAAPLLILPCELIERNADKLRDLVVQQAQTWSLPQDFQQWIARDCTWLNNLVDRIVTLPADEHPLKKDDPLLIQAEPYALWAIERPRPGWEAPVKHPSVEAVDDLTPYYLRKVRILNGVHTALVGKFMPRGFETVQQALKDPEVMDWVLGLIYEEIVPVIAYRVPDVARFARQTLERFANPFLQHRLADIAKYHAEKVQVRLKTTAEEYERLFGKKPRRLLEAIGE
jgi:tagaturonate reductase